MSKAINLFFAGLLAAAVLAAAAGLARADGADGDSRGVCAERFCGAVFF